MSANDWTESAAEIGKLAAMADAIEIAGCRALDDAVERCDDQQADFYSVYFHFTPERQAEPNALLGALCIADRATLADARNFADALAAAHSIPVNNFTGEPS